VLHAFSEAVVPRPADWPDHVDVTGWLFSSERSEPLPPEVEAFLADGEAPLYIGFGSMRLPRPEETARTVVTALVASGHRAIISGEALGSARALQNERSVLTVDHVDHDALFKRVAGVVHHGGSGTTGAGLRAGCPTLVVPTVVDQFFWGRRVAAIGAGPSPLPFNRLTSERLTAALRELRSDRIRSTAQQVGDRIAAENGVTRAVRSVERLLP
jgi:sterol 3beta-glucosyltransferase